MLNNQFILKSCLDYVLVVIITFSNMSDILLLPDLLWGKKTALR
jgi:hypothetical protein